MESDEREMKIVPYEEYMRLQTEIILSQDNIKKATEFFGHPPTRNEAACYYICSGQAIQFSKKYKILEKPSEKN